VWDITQQHEPYIFQITKSLDAGLATPDSDKGDVATIFQSKI
jgi:hypothetical protein